jgi:hypothetical protein
VEVIRELHDKALGPFDGRKERIHKPRSNRSYTQIGLTSIKKAASRDLPRQSESPG